MEQLTLPPGCTHAAESQCTACQATNNGSPGWCCREHCLSPPCSNLPHARRFPYRYPLEQVSEAMRIEKACGQGYHSRVCISFKVFTVQACCAALAVHRYPLEQVPEAMSALLDRKVQGKAIITTGQQQQQQQSKL